MTSIALDYDADDDWLDISFGRHDGLTREFALNDHITLTTDVTISRVTRVSFGEYVRMLLVSETEFTNLKDEEPHVVEDILYLLSVAPMNRLLDLTDPEALIARVCAPTLSRLVEDDGSEARAPW
ncbi:MAG: hypothetical protein FJX72_02060 [Armatimonadetes bacterium]|nr:hypothetical protein [Armatimonadota bacterium]